MRIVVLVLALIVFVPNEALAQNQTVTAFKTGERTTGMTKQCFYDALGSAYTRTVGAVDLCPLSIQVRIGGF